jgi:hypothetical protein
MIKDAVMLCKKLDIRFLWVDTLCIQQDDILAKTVAINNMDQIYSFAEVIIFGAAGINANAGLPRNTNFAQP